ncbi:putative casein kinase II subunit alpha like protein [Cucumispora dikerogammari]|nr:putative casein kinase II subunit alpha like protein [Cucumispora dikerogammari]
MQSNNDVYKELNAQFSQPHKYSIISSIERSELSSTYVGLTNKNNSVHHELLSEFEKYVAGKNNIYARMDELICSFRAEVNIQERTLKKCIIKIVNISIDDGYKREVYILKKLKHRSILKLIDAVEEPSYERIYLVYEYTSLFNTKLLFGDMDIADIKFYARHILEGLNYAHKRGIVHRDIKPSNLLINPLLKSLKIKGWDQAEQVDLCVSPEVGSKGYKAPELLFNLSYGCKIDVWGFGCVFGEMLFNKQLFSDDCNFDSYIRILGESGAKTFLRKYQLSFLVRGLASEDNEERFLLREIQDIKTRQVLDYSLAYDPEERYCCEALLSSTYFMK